MELDSFFPENKLLSLEKYQEGQMILVDKPLDWTSFDVVKKMKNTLRTELGVKKIKIGHAGTLDPKATGLLIVCIGKFTKKIPLIQDAPKEYIAKIKLGATTPCLDTEMEESEWKSYDHINTELIEKSLETFTGKYLQTPPIHSALKVGGKRAYTLARKGEEVQLKRREIEFINLELLENQLPEITVKINCSKGTYVRSFARDLALEMNTVGYLTGLRRTRIGSFEL